MIARASGLSFKAILMPLPITRLASPAAMPPRAAVDIRNGGEAVVEARQGRQDGHGRDEEGEDSDGDAGAPWKRSTMMTAALMVLAPSRIWPKPRTAA